MEFVKGIRSISDLADRVETNPELKKLIGEKPSEVLHAAATEVPNTFVYRAAVSFVGASLILLILGGIYLAGTGTGAPEWLVSTAAAGIGALAGMLRSG